MPDNEDFQHAVARLQSAMTKVLNGDTTLIKALHSHADDVTSFYGMGGYEKGWDAVSKRWDWGRRWITVTFFAGDPSFPPRKRRMAGGASAWQAA